MTRWSSLRCLGIQTRVLGSLCLDTGYLLPMTRLFLFRYLRYSHLMTWCFNLDFQNSSFDQKMSIWKKRILLNVNDSTDKTNLWGFDLMKINWQNYITTRNKWDKIWKCDLTVCNNKSMIPLKCIHISCPNAYLNP